MSSYFDIGCAAEEGTVSGADAVTRAQALDLLALVDKHLTIAHDLIDEISFANVPAVWTGQKAALFDQIRQLRGYASKVRAELVKAPEGPLSPTLAAKAQLAAKQAVKALSDTDKAVNGARSPLLPEFLEAMKQILAGLANAVPAWAWAVGAGLLGLTAISMLPRARS